uniref:C2H2-type domain-containing protein n=1 Tax=Anopheles farauti TaxID=69004 RepID=A0A182QUN6_9DIPT
MEFTAKETVLNLLQRYATGARSKDDEFFREGNFYLKPFKKLGVLSEFPEVDPEPEDLEMNCNVPDCNFFCHSVADYELHYNAQHRYTCAQCKKSLPNAHLLDLHLSEAHDSYFAAQVQSSTKAMYACYLEECIHRSKDPAERRDHCIREHNFPHNFRFDKQVPSKSIKSRAAETPVSDKLPVQECTVLPRCRKNFSFGHPQQRAFKAVKQGHKTCDILESNKMVVDLLESLPKE